MVKGVIRKMKHRKNIYIILVGFLFLTLGANNAFSEEPGVTNVISVNPIGLIFGVGNVE